MALSLGITAMLLPRIDWEKMTRERLEKSGQTVTDEKVQSAVVQGKKVGGVISYGIGAISPWVVALVTAVVIWGSFKAFGWDSSFKAALGVTSHAFLAIEYGPRSGQFDGQDDEWKQGQAEHQTGDRDHNGGDPLVKQVNT